MNAGYEPCNRVIPQAPRGLKPAARVGWAVAALLAAVTMVLPDATAADSTALTIYSTARPARSAGCGNTRR